MLAINKLCSFCLKGHGVFQKHSYTIFGKWGQPIELENCGFILCDFCAHQVLDAHTIERISSEQ